MAMFYNGDPRRRQLRDEMRWMEDNFNEKLAYERKLADGENWEQQPLRKHGKNVASPKNKAVSQQQTPERKCPSQEKKPITPLKGKHTEDVKRCLFLQHKALGSDPQAEKVQKKGKQPLYKSSPKK